jgi:hypothetical protein
LRQRRPQQIAAQGFSAGEIVALRYCSRVQREAHVGSAERTGNGGAGLTGEAQRLALSAFGAGRRKATSCGDGELGESGLAVGQLRGEQLELVRGLDDAAASEQAENSDTEDGDDLGHVHGGELGELFEAGRTLGLFDEDAIEGEYMQVRIESEVGVCSLHHGDGTALKLREPALVYRFACRRR